VTNSNCNRFTNSPILQFTIGRAKSSPSSLGVATQRLLTMGTFPPPTPLPWGVCRTINSNWDRSVSLRTDSRLPAESELLYDPAALPQGRPTSNLRGWAQEPVAPLWRREKFLAPTGNVTPAVQPIARRYTDWTIPGRSHFLYGFENRPRPYYTCLQWMACHSKINIC
jgi:hypothetical protein